MADNYLEKKMEEHRRGSAPAKRSRLTPSGARQGEIIIKMEPRRVFVTGGAHGIGRAIVKAFCDSGSRVAFCDIDTRTGARTAQETGARFYPVDVCRADALDKAMSDAIAHFGDIDIIVNNVGVSDFKPLTELTDDDFDRVMATNVRPIIVLARRMALTRQGRTPEQNNFGRVINISSTRAMMSETGTEAYSASKGAVTALTHALMMSLAPLGVTVNAIAPGWIDTGNTESPRPIDHQFHPSRRVGRPEDVARLCLWLSRQSSDFLNGETITLDGGVTHQMLYPS